QRSVLSFILFLHHTPTTPIYTLSLHDALPISVLCRQTHSLIRYCLAGRLNATKEGLNSCSGEVLVRRSSQRTHKCCAANSPSRSDRKSTRLNSSHDQISYAVFCLKKKKTVHYI